jgi:co-chaperonin GroES (HSP10)
MLIPTRGKVLVEVLSQVKKLPSGLFLADTIKETPSHGKVVALGEPDINSKGKTINPCCKVNDIVHFKKQYFTFWEHEGKKFVFLTNEDIIAKEEKID